MYIVELGSHKTTLSCEDEELVQLSLLFISKPNLPYCRILSACESEWSSGQSQDNPMKTKLFCFITHLFPFLLTTVQTVSVCLICASSLSSCRVPLCSQMSCFFVIFYCSSVFSFSLLFVRRHILLMPFFLLFPCFVYVKSHLLLTF